jgi:hypothetical protein
MDFIYNIFNYNNNSTIYSNLMKDIYELIDQYETYKFDEKGCDTLEILYDDKLMKLKMNELSEILVIGLKYNIPHNTSIDKQKYKKLLCKKIIEHFRKRYELLIDVHNSIEKCMKKLSKIKSGDYCKNIDINIDINNFDACIKNKGEWISKKDFTNEINRIKNNNDILTRNYYVNKLKNDINHHLKLLHKEVVEKIKEELKYPKDEYYFNNLEKETFLILKRMELSTDALFKIIINY